MEEITRWIILKGLEPQHIIFMQNSHKNYEKIKLMQHGNYDNADDDALLLPRLLFFT